MAPALIEKYELILSADPRSRVFVELARALIDGGKLQRAVEICRQGLEHHPGSIQGRLVWAKALLLEGDVDGAMGQIDAAMSIEPSSPYAYNLAAELFLQHGLTARAVPILEKALALQPSNERVRRWLVEAKEATGQPADLPPVVRLAPAEGAEGSPAAQSTGEPQAAARSATDPDEEKTLELQLPPSEKPNAPAPVSTSAANADPASESLKTPPPISASQTPAPPSLPRKGTPPPPPPIRRPITDPRFALAMIPDAAKPAATPVPARPAPSATEVNRIAHEYERELRLKLVDAPGPPPGFLRRHWIAVLSVGLALLVAIGGWTTYVLVRRQHRAQEVAADVQSAKKGLARDTVGALREAARVLTEVREVAPSHQEALSLSVQVAALLGAEYGDAAARELAQRLAATGEAGEGALAARYILATSTSERAAAADPLIAANTSNSLLLALAGEALLVRGDTEGGLKKLEAAARASPPLLRALADLGDHYRQTGDLEQALGYYQATLAGHPTHPRAALGGAEIRLTWNRDLDAALRDLKAVDADASSAPPTAYRIRFELALSRLLAATGDRTAAAARLDRVAEKLGARAEASATTAEILLASGALDRAVSEAEQAIKLAPQEISYRVLLAKALAGRGQYREIIRATEKLDAREIGLWRGIARYELGEYAKARSEFDRTRRDGRMPAEAAAYYALAEFALGREPQARALLHTLTSLPSPPAIAFIATGLLEEARGQSDAAEREYRAAVVRDPSSLEGNCALGRLLVARGRPADALPFLERAALVNPFHSEARIALARARLVGGDARAARDELSAVLASDPRNAAALRASVEAAIADRDPAGARRAADRALAADPGNPQSWLAAARATMAQGEYRLAQRFAERAAKLGNGASVAEAKRLVAQAKQGR